MPQLQHQLSPVSRYYLHRLVRTLVAAGSTQAAEIESAEALELRLTTLDATAVGNLDYFLHLHRELSSQDSAFQEDIPKLEVKIFSALGIQIQPQSAGATLTFQIPIGEMLLNRGLITKQQLDSALVEQSATNKRVGEILVTRNLITFDQLDQLLWEQVATRA